MVSPILGNSFLFFSPRLSRSLIVMMQATLKSKVSSLHLQLLELINILAMSAIACLGRSGGGAGNRKGSLQ